jgi:class 3 adenylate cyclase
MIFNTVTTHRFKGKLVRCIKEAVVRITRQRDDTFEQVREKLSNLKKQQGPTGHKLRHVWDLVIQGNVSEMETSARRAISAVEQNDADFKHLFRQFPNNKYVAGQYANFLREITADPRLTADMEDKRSRLARGIHVHPDLAHDCGLETFPGIPESLRSAPQQTPCDTLASARTTDTVEEQSVTPFDEQKLIIRERLETIRIPSVFMARILLVFFFLIVILIPVLGIVVFCTSFFAELESEAIGISPLAEQRALSIEISAFGLRMVGENLGAWDPVDPGTANPPAYLGNSWNTTVQLRQLIGLAVGATQRASMLWVVGRSSEAVREAQTLVFATAGSYPYYTSPSERLISSTTISGALTMISLQQESLSLENNYTSAILNTTALMNPIACIGPLDINLAAAIQLLLDDINGLSEQLTIQGPIVLAAVIIAVLVIGVSLVVGISRGIRAEKQGTYHCLAALPKSAVSDIVECLRKHAQEHANADDDSDLTTREVSKREEYVMKVLNAGGSSSLKYSDLIVFMSGCLLLVVFQGVVAVLVERVLIAETDAFRSQLPHLTTILTSYSHALFTIYGLHRLVLNRTGYGIYIGSEQRTLNEINAFLESGRAAYYLASYGGDGSWEHPYSGWHDGVTKARAAMACNTDYDEQRRSSQAMNCLPPDLAYVSIEPFVVSQLEHIDVEKLTQMWRIMVSPLLDLFFFPLYDTVLSVLANDLWDDPTRVLQIIIGIIVLQTLIAIIVWVELDRVGNHIRGVLKFLLHCPSAIVIQNQAIISVLMGDFSGKGSNAERDLRRNTEFFELVFLRLPDAILYANTSMIVERGNYSATRLFERDLTGEDLRQFFLSETFIGNTDALLEFGAGSTSETLVFHRNDGQETHLSVTIADTGTEIIASCRDVTQSVRCNKLIAEERKRSDDLLKTILPESLVPRVQAGEQNIVFSVEIASILFLDIVSFTPWCGKLPAQTVMATLNDMFKRLDERLARKSTITKIKCIGDCYMAAGGIFSAKDRPREHAIEVVTFGLEAIQAMRELNADMEENLEIRVGVNTGGPIVAGVLGIGKPTFEILGPAINMAQQMEHTGSRMLVHISQQTYVHIVNEPFMITESTANVKGNILVTYLVSARAEKR